MGGGGDRSTIESFKEAKIELMRIKESHVWRRDRYVFPIHQKRRINVATVFDSGRINDDHLG